MQSYTPNCLNIKAPLETTKLGKFLTTTKFRYTPTNWLDAMNYTKKMIRLHNDNIDTFDLPMSLSKLPKDDYEIFVKWIRSICGKEFKRIHNA